jgi:hypothetical protein
MPNVELRRDPSGNDLWGINLVRTPDAEQRRGLVAPADESSSK